MAAGLRARDIELANAEIFSLAPGDISVARSDAGPLIVARPGYAASPKWSCSDFNPVRSGLKYQLTTPLLIRQHHSLDGARCIPLLGTDRRHRRHRERRAGIANSIPNTVRVQTEDGQPLPFTDARKNAALLHRRSRNRASAHRRSRARLFAHSSAARRHRLASRLQRQARRARPRALSVHPRAIIWQWLALAGAAGLIADWILYGRMDRRMRAARDACVSGAPLERKAS